MTKEEPDRAIKSIRAFNKIWVKDLTEVPIKIDPSKVIKTKPNMIREDFKE